MQKVVLHACLPLPYFECVSKLVTKEFDAVPAGLLITLTVRYAVPFEEHLANYETLLAPFDLVQLLLQQISLFLYVDFMQASLLHQLLLRKLQLALIFDQSLLENLQLVR